MFIYLAALGLSCGTWALWYVGLVASQHVGS